MFRKKSTKPKKTRSKFRAEKTEVDGIVFDSKLESRFYLHLKELTELGEVLEFSLQPEFILQDKFKREGKTVQPIKYKSDFWVKWKDGREEIIDTKGTMLTVEFKLKRKMFWYRYPHLTLKLITHVAKYGGWLELEEYEKRKKEEKKKK